MFVKSLLAFAAAVLTVTPAFALETEISGFLRVRGIADNFNAVNNFIGRLAEDVDDEFLTDQRLRLKLDAKVNENLALTYYGEVDFQWGDSQYEGDPGRQNGGGIGADTTNWETKHVYLDVLIPDSPVAARIGLQGLDDHWDYSFFTADMAGAKFNVDLGTAGITAGWFNLVEGDFDESDDVHLWALQADFKPSENLKGGLDYYLFQNQGTPGYATFFGTADLADIDFLFDPELPASWSSTREDMTLHYFGGHGEYRMSEVVLNGWAFTNIGTVDSIQNDLAAPGTTEDIDVRGLAASLRADTNLGGLQTSLRGYFFSGDDDLTDGDADFIVNPLATESFAFAEDGFMIFFPDAFWTSVGQYGFAMVDAAFAGYGLWGGNLSVSYEPIEKINLKGGVAYVASLEDSMAPGDPRVSRNGTSLGTEAFFRASYRMLENLDLSVNGAYAWLGDFYDETGGGTAVTVPGDPDNPYQVYLMANLTF